MEALRLLEGEHRLIERMLDRALAALDPFDRGRLDTCLEFFVHFADEVHHAKEEKVLFEQMRKVQPIASGPIAVMERDHAPQHGAMFRGQHMVSRFIDWVESAPCGLDLLPEEDWSVPEWAGSVDH
jgi:hemerythrin-like domain-containing protein